MSISHLLMISEALNTATGERRATVEAHQRLMVGQPMALAAIRRCVETGERVCFDLRGSSSTVEPWTPTRRYLAVKLDAGNDRNGNPRRGWLVYEDSPICPLLGWIEEGYSGWAALYAGILCAELDDPKAIPSTRELADLRDKSGRVREVCSVSVPFSEVRDARRNPFSL